MDPAKAQSRDVQRNLLAVRAAALCYRRQDVVEGRFHWVFHLLENRAAPSGPFWVLPHDNEDTAFDAGVYAVSTYGGGLLAVDSGGGRRFGGQDPNRNFSGNAAESGLCRDQRRAAPAFTSAILGHYQRYRGPYLSLHNNHDGWSGGGGRGTVSVYRRVPMQYGYPSFRGVGRLRDGDNLVFMAGVRSPMGDAAARRRIRDLNVAGLNVVFKHVTDASFDCSFSDYVARHRLGEYFNLEAEYGHRETQREMIDRLMGVLGIERVQQSRRASAFLDP